MSKTMQYAVLTVAIIVIVFGSFIVFAVWAGSLSR